MSEKNSKEETQEQPTQLLPDGIGLTVEEVRTLLLKKNNVNVPADDPALMYVTIMNAFLEEQAKLQKSHQVALGKMMSEHTKQHVEATKKDMTALMQTLSKLTSDGLNDAAKDITAFHASMISNMRICTAVCFISCMGFVGALAYAAYKGLF